MNLSLSTLFTQEFMSSTVTVTIYSSLYHAFYIWKPHIKRTGISDPHWYVMINMQKLHSSHSHETPLSSNIQETTEVNPSFLIQLKPIQVWPFKTWTLICFSHWGVCTITSLAFKIKSQNYKIWRQLSMLNEIQTLIYNTVTPFKVLPPQSRSIFFSWQTTKREPGISATHSWV